MKSKLLLGIGIAVVVIAILWRFLPARKDQASTSTQSAERLQIVASFYPLYFFTKEIVGDNAEVANLTPAGAEPHDYELTTQDAARLEKADLVIVNGRLEPWAERIGDEFIERGKPLLTVTEGVSLEDSTDDEGRAVKDPHVWLSPRLSKTIVEKIADAVSRLDQANTAAYGANAKMLMDKLDALDTQFRQGLSSCKQKNIITAHAAFGYTSRDYGFTQVPIAGLSPDAEPTAQDLAEVTRFAREKQIKYIFFESLVSPKLAQTIAREVGAQTLVLNPIEGLTPEEEKQGKNYFTEMEQNLNHLRIALQCQ